MGPAANPEGHTATGEPLLAGVRVVDLSRYLPGPFCTLQLAQLGAEVTVVERAPSGDPMRGVPPFGPDGEGLASASLARGKRRILVDLADEGDRAQVMGLLAAADVVVEGFRPGVADAMGVGYEAVRESNPGVVYCSLTGYGQDGPYAMRAGHDATYLAASGFLARNGVPERPVLPAVPTADVAGGSFAATAICAALVRRARTGEGAHLDIALAEAALAWQSHALPQTTDAGEAGRESGLLTGGYAWYAVYRCAEDTFLAVAPVETKFFAILLDALELPSDLVIAQFDPRRQDELRRLIAERLATRRAEEWESDLGPRDACVAAVLDAAGAAQHPQHVARGALTTLHGDAAYPVPTSPFMVDGVRSLGSLSQ